MLAVLAIGRLSSLLIAGMCIDISHLYMAKIELQDAAAAAALAGAGAALVTERKHTLSHNQPVLRFGFRIAQWPNLTANLNCNFSLILSSWVWSSHPVRFFSWSGGGNQPSGPKTTCTGRKILRRRNIPPESTSVIDEGSKMTHRSG